MIGEKIKMKDHNRQRSNRISPKSEKHSKEVKSPKIPTLGNTTKSTTSDSDRAYFKSRKPKIPKEIEEATEKEKFMKKYGEVLEI